MVRKIAREEIERYDELAKADKIIELRRTGASWELIARATGYANASGAYKAYQKIVSEMVFPQLEEYRNMELDLLDRLQLGVFDRAKSGDLRAISTVLAISDRRAKLLGLDAPTKVQAEVITYDDAGIAESHRRFMELLTPSQQETNQLGTTPSEA